MNKYLSDNYFLRENYQCLKESQTDCSSPMCSLKFQKIFLDIFPNLNSCMSLEEENDENNYKLFFSTENQNHNCIIEYEGDLKPQFIAKIEKEDEKKLPEYFKLDSCIKHFKVSITEYMTDLLNLFLKNNLNFKILFQIPSSKMFTANTNYIDNFDYLFKKIKNILIIGIENKEVHAVNNYELIKLIYKDDSEKSKKIKNILELNYENIIQAFYNDTKIFEKFKQSKFTQFYNDKDKGFPKQFKYSLLENYGFLVFLKYKSFPRDNKDKVILQQKRKRLLEK